MFNGRRYLYVGFMCHQVIEKSLKGIYVKQRKKIPPYTHNLLSLCAELKFDLTEQQKKFLNKLNPLNIEARYPDLKEKLGKTLNRKRAEKNTGRNKDNV